MYAIRSYYDRAVHTYDEATVNDIIQKVNNTYHALFVAFEQTMTGLSRITSYNVCYTKLLREKFFNTAGPIKPDLHYYIPSSQRLDWGEIWHLIDSQKYFV